MVDIWLVEIRRKVKLNFFNDFTFFILCHGLPLLLLLFRLFFLLNSLNRVYTFRCFFVKYFVFYLVESISKKGSKLFLLGFLFAFFLLLLLRSALMHAVALCSLLLICYSLFLSAFPSIAASSLLLLVILMHDLLIYKLLLYCFILLVKLLLHLQRQHLVNHLRTGFHFFILTFFFFLWWRFLFRLVSKCRFFFITFLFLFFFFLILGIGILLHFILLLFVQLKNMLNGRIKHVFYK